LSEFLLFTVLQRRLGRAHDARQPVRFARVPECASDAALVLSLIAQVRLAASAGPRPTRPRVACYGICHAANCRGCNRPAERGERARSVESTRAALPPALIKACAAVAFVDGATEWKAASCLRTICAALDSPLPPQLGDDILP